MKEVNNLFAIYGAQNFVCPTCSVYSQHKWYEIIEKENKDIYLDKGIRVRGPGYTPFVSSSEEAKRRKTTGFLDNLTALSVCTHCNKPAIWIDEKLVYPKNISVEPPNSDMPEDVKKLYDEAREISVLSPRASAALLRLALEKLLPSLGAQGKRINDMIGDLVKKGLSPTIQQALDSLRVIGNEAVHPGSIDLDEEKEVALALFKLINLVVEQMITEKKEIQAIYDLIPKDKLDGIQNRDHLKTTK
ncbi:DUF4145 domain-containing protein [Bacillus subtilis]|uniref:DUF4145 domain-containing protein n=2 Tax=Bacillus subtilis TaxID=1423 RepID=UPI0033161614